MKGFKKILASFESAAKFIGEDPAALPVVTGMTEKYRANIVSGHMLDILSEAAWKLAGIDLDWNDGSQRKYYAWWDMRDQVSSGPGVRFYDFADDRVYSFVGSRRVFPSREILEYMVKQHFQLFVDTLVIKKAAK